MSKPKEFAAFEQLAKKLLAVPQEEYREQFALHDRQKRKRAKPGKITQPAQPKSEN